LNNLKNATHKKLEVFMALSLSSILTSTEQLAPYIIQGIEALIILVVGSLLSKMLSSMIKKIVASRFDSTMGTFAKQFTFYSFMFLVVIAVLSKLGVQTTSLIAILGGMSVAVGLSLRSSLSNLASGILLIMFKPFSIGNQISVDGNQGEVTDIALLFTYLKDSDNNQVTVPNNKLVTNVVTRYQKT
jgi:small conductance mechanosensitive channel